MTDDVDDETFQELLTVLRRFVAERLVPLEEEVEETNAVPESIITEMKEMGLFGLSIPAAYGGLDLNVVQETEVSLVFGETSSASSCPMSDLAAVRSRSAGRRRKRKDTCQDWPLAICAPAFA